MRRFLIAAIVFTFFGRPCPAGVDELRQPNRVVCNVKEEIEHYLLRHGPSCRKAVILARDHFGGWSGYVWNGRALEADRQRFSNLHLDQPRVDLSKGEELLVFVTNTNPMLFSAVQTEASLVAREDVANLQAFLAALAGVITGATRSVGEIRIDKGQRAQIEAMKRDVSVQMAQRPLRTAKPLEELARIAINIDSNVVEARKAVDTPMVALKAEAERIQLLSQRVADNEAAALALVSRIEAGGAGLAVLPVIEEGIDNRTLPGELESAFRSLVKKRDALQLATMSCGEPVGLAKSAIRTRIDGFAGADAAAVAQAQRTYNALLSALQEAPLDCAAPLSQNLQALGTWLQKNPRDDSQKAVLETLFLTLDGYERTSKQRTAVLEPAKTVAANRLTLINSAGTFRTWLALQDSAWDGDDCSLTAGVILVQRFSRTEVDQPFDKNGSETFTVGVRKGFENVALRHPQTVRATYLVAARRDFDVDVDFGPIYTPLVDPTFGVVTRPVAASLHAAATERKTIEVTDEKPQAGQIAVFGTVKWWRFTILRPQIGALVSVDHPGAFLGLAWAPTPYFKLGGGWTWQQVTALADGLKEGQEVTSDSELRTREHFANNWYVSLSITIDNLPFWKKP